jgi:hypothetical protein
VILVVEIGHAHTVSFGGVTFVWVVDGVNWDCFQKGLQEWRKRHTADDRASS